MANRQPEDVDPYVAIDYKSALVDTPLSKDEIKALILMNEVNSSTIHYR